jgi:two-component system, cell cycle response regulator
MESVPESNGKVLIVDDEEAGRETLSGLLVPLNVSIRCAGDGLEALAITHAWKPDLVLLDVMMPGMDGFDVCRAIRADSDIGETPILLITALDDPDSRLEGFQVGADDFITKPIIRTELRMRIRSLLRLNRYRRLVSAQTRFEWIAEQSTNGLLILDRDERITYLNSAARKLLGIPGTEAVETLGTFREQAAPHFRLEPVEDWKLPLNEAKRNSPLYLLRPETAVTPQFWLQVTPLELPVSDHGDFALRLTNITDQKVQHLAQWHFHTALNHKLRTPLAVILGALELLEYEGDAATSDFRKEMVGLAYQGVNELKSKVDQALQFVNIVGNAKGKSVFPNEAQVSLIETSAKSLGLPTPEIHYDPALDGLAIPLDPFSMESIFLELLGNSIKFHPHKTPTIEVSLTRSETCLLICLADDGLTLSLDQLEKVWLPYFQGERLFTGQMPGLGLGLSAVSTLIWGTGGDCEMVNRPNQAGVEVRLMIPLVAPGQTETHPETGRS